MVPSKSYAKRSLRISSSGEFSDFGVSALGNIEFGSDIMLKLLE